MSSLKAKSYQPRRTSTGLRPKASELKASHGFTLIELLVVIAIIGVLSTIVIANVQSTRDKAANASVKSGLHSIVAAAQLISDATNSFSTVCIDADINRTYTAAGVAGGGAGVCNNSTTAWAVQAPLKAPEGDNTYWCVDSTGAVGGSATPLGASRSCP